MTLFFNFDFFADDDAAIAVLEIIDVLGTVKTGQAQSAERRSGMTQLIRMIREGKNEAIQENFRYKFIHCLLKFENLALLMLYV